MEDVKNRIEAILFTTGRFMDLEEIGKLCGIGSIGMVKDALKELKEDYNKKENSLEIIEENKKFKLAIRKQYIYLTSKLLNDTEFNRPVQETLAIIAFKQPMMQCDVVKIRGNNAYDHVKILRENEFITSEKHGRTRLLKLTSKFFDYFDIAEQTLKEGLEEIGEKLGIKEVEEEEKKLDELEIQQKEEAEQKEEKKDSEESKTQ